MLRSLVVVILATKFERLTHLNPGPLAVVKMLSSVNVKVMVRD
jgi:hypothetical protein